MRMMIVRFLTAAATAACVFQPGSIFCIQRAQDAGNVREICHTEIFRGSCSKDEVILVQSAQYGRIHIGRCVTEDFGYLGCMHDVMPEMTSLCSGRHGCEVRIDDNTFTRTTPCHRDLKSHLWVKYDCVKVITPERPCHVTRSTETLLSISSSSSHPQFLSSQVTEDSGCGTADSPWVIGALPGQRINLTLYDFSLEAALAGEESNPEQDDRLCRVYATVRDRSASSRSMNICEGVAAKVNAFTSTTHKVEVRLRPAVKVKAGSKFKEEIQQGFQAQFLIQFKAIGCAIPLLGDGVALLSRTSDALYLGCGTRDSSSPSSSTWQLRCIDNQWIGRQDNCSRGSSPTTRYWTEVRFPRETSISYGHSIVVVALIAVAVICVIMVSGTVFIKWRHKADRRNRRPATEMTNKFSKSYEFSGSSLLSPVYKDLQKAPIYEAAEDASSTLKVNDYATWRLLASHSPCTMVPTCRLYESLDVAPLASASSRTYTFTPARKCTPYYPAETLAWEPVKHQSISICKPSL